MRPRRPRWLPLLAALLGVAQTRCEPATDPREALLVCTLVRADQGVLRNRPALVAGKYARMATGAFEF